MKIYYKIFLLIGLLLGIGAFLKGTRLALNLRSTILDWLNIHTSFYATTREDIDAYIRKLNLNPVQGFTHPAMGKGPLRYNKASPRYFSDARGRLIYLAGSHTWLNFQDGGLTDPPPRFDYSKWLDFLQANRHNFFRLWVWEQTKWVSEWSTPYYFSPHPYQRTGPGIALDGKPKFDLMKFNQAYFDRMRRRVVQAGRRGIYVSIMLFNGWSVAFPKGRHDLANPWHGHPFNIKNNINGINGDINGDDSGIETQQLRIKEVTAIQEAYVKKVIDTVNDLDNVLYEISNESDNQSTRWQYHMINFIKNYESKKPKQHPVGMTAEYPMGDDSVLFDSPADWISPQCGFRNPPAAEGGKVIIADTDHLCGICGDYNWVWRSFTRGRNLLFMDQYDDSYKLDGGGYDISNQSDFDLRRNLGVTLFYADRMNLAVMAPCNELASTGYCMAHPAEVGAEYLIYVPGGGSITVDLRRSHDRLLVEWFNPRSCRTVDGSSVAGGALHSFEAPFDGDAVLYLSNKARIP